MGIRAGGLKERIAIEAPTRVCDSTGGEASVTWAVMTATPLIWAAVTKSRGEEGFRAAALQSLRTVKFLVRYLAGVTPDMRVVWQGQNYDIFDVDESRRHRGELWILATAKVKS